MPTIAERRRRLGPVTALLASVAARFGVTGCSADLPGLAVRMPLDPPIEH